jgi:putative membrane protein
MVLQQWSSFVNFLTYLVVAIPLLLIGIKIFMLQTPYNEMKMIQEAASCDKTEKDEAGIAIAHDLGGKIVGQALVMASAVFHSVSIGDLIIWGIVGIIFQVLVYYAFAKLTTFKVSDELIKGNIAVGIFSSRLSFATGLILAALIS